MITRDPVTPRRAAVERRVVPAREVAEARPRDVGRGEAGRGLLLVVFLEVEYEV